MAGGMTLTMTLFFNEYRPTAPFSGGARDSTRPHHAGSFTWWGCYGLCLRHKPTELAHSFHSVLVSVSVFMALSPVIYSINSPNNSRFLTPFFQSYFCLVVPLNCIFLYESLPQP